MRDTFEERIARSVRRMVPGGFAGRTEQVAPILTPGRPPQTYRPSVVKAILTFSGGPGLAVSTSGPDHLRQPLTLFAVSILHSLTPASDTTVNVLKNGAAINPSGAGSPDMVLGPLSPDPKRIRFDFLDAWVGAEDPVSADIGQVELTTADSTADQYVTIKLLFG